MNHASLMLAAAMLGVSATSPLDVPRRRWKPGGVVTRPPVGDEAVRVAALGITPPIVEEFQHV